MNLVELPVPNLNDIPDMLEILAEGIREGECGDVRSMVVAFESAGSIDSRMFGHLDLLSAIGLHKVAGDLLSRTMLDDE